MDADTSLTNIKGIERIRSGGALVWSDNLELKLIRVHPGSEGDYTADSSYSIPIPGEVQTVHDVSFGAYYNCGWYIHMATDYGIYRKAQIILTHPCFEGPTGWVKTSDGLPHENIRTHAFGPHREGDHGGFDQFSYVGLNAEEGRSAIYIRANIELTTSIEDDPATPDRFALHQNHPNPFNPSTNITFTLPTSTEVQITVYNLLGRHIKTLVDGPRPAGTHEITYNASDLSSGVYVYRLRTEEQLLTRKMLLIK